MFRGKLYCLMLILASVKNSTCSNACEPISAPLCKDIEYNMTRFPNSLGHQLQEDAALEVRQFFPFIKIKCSVYLKPFLCCLFIPKCDHRNLGDQQIQPPRELCESAQQGCEPLMTKFGFYWPDALNCSQFPDLSSLPEDKKQQNATVKQYNAVVGESVTIECNVQSDQTIAIWNKYVQLGGLKVKIQPTRRFKFSVGRLPTLTISEIGQHDYGYYECNTWGGGGSKQSMQIYLRVVARQIKNNPSKKLSELLDTLNPSTTLYQLNIQYSLTAITFTSCCHVFAYAGKTYSLPPIMEARVRSADVRSSSVPKLTWRKARTKPKHDMEWDYATIFMVNGYLDANDADPHLYVNWFVTNIYNDDESTGITIKEYLGPHPKPDTGDKIYFLLYKHSQLVNLQSIGTYSNPEHSRYKMNLEKFTNDNRMTLVASRYMIVDIDEYSRFLTLQEFGQSESDVCGSIPGYTQGCGNNFTPASFVLRK